MPYVTYPNIGQTYSGPLGVPNMDFGNIVQQWQQSQNALRNEQLNQQAAQQEYEQAQAINPYKVQEAADAAKIKRLEADYAERAQPDKLEKLRQQVGETKFKALDTTMQQLGQLGAMIESNGGVVPLQVRAYLQGSTEGQQILKAADADTNFGKSLREGGESWNAYSAKRLSQGQEEKSAEDLLREKLASQEARANADRLSRERIAAARLANAQKLMSMKPMKQDKQSFESYAIQLDKAADEVALDNPQAAATLRERAAFYRNEAMKKASASAATRAAQESAVIEEFTGRKVGQGAQAPSAPADPYAGFKIR